MKRIRHRCMWRLKHGPRAGQLCREPIEKGFKTEMDYCLAHQMIVRNKQAQQRLKQIEDQESDIGPKRY